MLTNSDLDWMRETLEQIMPDNCVILSVTNVSDGQGGYEQTWGTVNPSLRCRIDPGRKETFERPTGAKLEAFSWWQLTVPHDAVITVDNRVVVNGETYTVVNLDGGKSWQGTIRAVLVQVET